MNNQPDGFGFEQRAFEKGLTPSQAPPRVPCSGCTTRSPGHRPPCVGSPLLPLPLRHHTPHSGEQHLGPGRLCHHRCHLPPSIRGVCLLRVCLRGAFSKALCPSAHASGATHGMCRSLAQLPWLASAMAMLSRRSYSSRTRTRRPAAPAGGVGVGEMPHAWQMGVSLGWP